MTKAELGTKRVCPNCGSKYYDLNRDPIVCPRCGTVFEVVAVSTRGRKPAPEVEEAPDEPKSESVTTISLEEADEEATESGAVKIEGDEGEEIEDDEDDTFLAPEEEDEDDDVDDIVGDVDDDET